MKKRRLRTWVVVVIWILSLTLSFFVGFMVGEIVNKHSTPNIVEQNNRVVSDSGDWVNND